jgi:hypothetical protein
VAIIWAPNVPIKKKIKRWIREMGIRIDRGETEKEM